VQGDAVTLTSTSSDPDGRVASQAWDLDNDGAFDDGTGTTATWTAPAAGAYSVSLRAVDNKGAAAAVTKTITVSAPPAPPGQPAPPAGQPFDVSAPVDPPPVTPAATPLRWLSPFPTVRMRGRTTRRGAQLTMLTVRGPHGSIAEVRCKGKGCPAKKVSRAKIKTHKKTGSKTIHFRRFERFLPAGVELQVSVTKKGMVGKYTRIKIRKLALPSRTDRCLLPDAKKPSACPATP
jgi:PKD repeat protein